MLRNLVNMLLFSKNKLFQTSLNLVKILRFYPKLTHILLKKKSIISFTILLKVLQTSLKSYVIVSRDLKNKKSNQLMTMQISRLISLLNKNH